MNRHAKRQSGFTRSPLFNRTAICLISGTVTLLLSLAATDARAVGTAAGTIIGNYATVNYKMEGKALSQQSNISSLRVDDKVSFTLSAADATNVTITPGGKAYMTYILSNSGNGSHDFTLNPSVSGTPEFTPAAGPVFFADAGATTPLPVDPNTGNLPFIATLPPDTSRTVYMQIIAPTLLSDGQTVKYLVTAEAYQPANLAIVNPPVKSSTQASTDATVNKNKNPMAQYVILADGHGNGGDADRDGRYAVIANDGNGFPIGFRARTATVAVVKAVTVADRTGGSQPYPGATLHYTLTVSATGSGTAIGVVITDPIPANTTYIPGTLKLNDTPLSDRADSDAGDAGDTTAGVVTVKLGDMTSATPAQVITFDVKIN